MPSKSWLLVIICLEIHFSTSKSMLFKKENKHWILKRLQSFAKCRLDLWQIDAGMVNHDLNFESTRNWFSYLLFASLKVALHVANIWQPVAVYWRHLFCFLVSISPIPLVVGTSNYFTSNCGSNWSLPSHARCSPR